MHKYRRTGPKRGKNQQLIFIKAVETTALTAKEGAALSGEDSILLI